MFSSRRLRLFCWFIVIAWAGTIFYLSSCSGHEIEEMNVLRVWDKAAHFLAFAAGGATFAFALRKTVPWPWMSVIVCSALAVSAYGWSDEWHQQFTPGRSAKDVADWTADTLGGLTGSLLTAWIYARYTRPHRPSSPGA